MILIDLIYNLHRYLWTEKELGYSKSDCYDSDVTNYPLLSTVLVTKFPNSAEVFSDLDSEDTLS